MTIYRVHLSYSDEFDFASGNTAIRVAELLLENGNKREIEIKLIKEDKEKTDISREPKDTDLICDGSSDIEGWCREDD